MASGDMVTGFSSVAGGGAYSFQPAVGVEVMITYVGTPTLTSNQMYAGMFHGGSSCNVDVASTNANKSIIKLGINNTHYLRFQNITGGPIIASYSGIQTK